MENRSSGGACIRLRREVPVGTKIRLQWRWDQFSGTTKYCRNDGRDYVVGIQRDMPDSEAETPGKEISLALAGGKPERAPIWGGVERRKGNLPGAATAENGRHQSVPRADAATNPATFLMRALDLIDAMEPRLPKSRPQEFAVPRAAEQQGRPKEERKEASKEKKHMGRKWFDVGQKPEGQELDALSPAGPVNNLEPVTPPAAPSAMPERRITTMKAREVEDASSSIELLSMQDIYQSAGILNPRKGYSILKVVEMLRSEHLRGLAKEMKRTTVLVALDAAGITLDEVAQDARARMEAIDSYEKEQRRQFETLLARKADENQQIMAELERIKTAYAERMKRNLEGVAREKATFGNWLATKQQESQNISEALDLCLNRETSEPASGHSAGDNGLVSSPLKTV